MDTKKSFSYIGRVLSLLQYPFKFVSAKITHLKK